MKTYKTQIAAAKAFAESIDVIGMQGGWIYGPKRNGRRLTICQGWNVYADRCERKGRIAPVDAANRRGSWMIVEAPTAQKGI